MSMAGDLLGEKNQEKLFNLLLKRQENQMCADCPTKAPTWVSLDFGVFVCMNCSAAHRRLSRSVTRVYSTKIDSWNKSNFQIMDHVGNEIANSYFQFKQPTRELTIHSNPDDRVRFVTDKYVRKLYANPKSQNPVLTFLSKREHGILERPYQNQENHQVNAAVVNYVDGKEFISTNAAGTLHNERVRQEQKQISEKRFSSVSSPPLKPAIDLLDFTEDSHVSQKANKKVDLLGDDDDNNFSNWVSAPQISIPSVAQQKLNMQPQLQQTKSQPAATSTNLLDLYNAPQQAPKTIGGYLNQQQQQQQQIPQQSVQPIMNQTTAASTNKPVDLMSYYSSTSGQTATSSTSNQFNQQQQQQVQQAQQQPDKSRFQALNQMGQYPMQNGGAANYYPYYQMQQGYGMQQGQNHHQQMQQQQQQQQYYLHQQQQQQFYGMQNVGGFQQQQQVRWP